MRRRSQPSSVTPSGVPTGPEGSATGGSAARHPRRRPLGLQGGRGGSKLKQPSKTGEVGGGSGVWWPNWCPRGGGPNFLRKRYAYQNEGGYRNDGVPEWWVYRNGFPSLPMKMITNLHNTCEPNKMRPNEHDQNCATPLLVSCMGVTKCR